MTMHPVTVKCAICKTPIPVEDVKYHTSQSEPRPVQVFCGPECSLYYYQEKKKCQSNTENQ